MLSLSDVHSAYSRSRVLHGVSLTANDNQVTCLLGRNGMGKTTTLMTIMGVVPPVEGQISLDGVSIGGKKPHEIAALGLTLVPEGRWVFGSLSVEENLRIAATASKRSESRVIDEILPLFPDLVRRRKQKASRLSGGLQQMLAIARALATRPKTVLLDEPSQGLAPVYVRRVAEYIQRARDGGVSFLLVEQNWNMAMAVADYIYVISHGKVVFEGEARELADSDDIVRKYLGMGR